MFSHAKVTLDCCNDVKDAPAFHNMAIAEKNQSNTNFMALGL
jgi:hypothetical protein